MYPELMMITGGHLRAKGGVMVSLTLCRVVGRRLFLLVSPMCIVPAEGPL